MRAISAALLFLFIAIGGEGARAQDFCNELLKNAVFDSATQKRHSFQDYSSVQAFCSAYDKLSSNNTSASGSAFFKDIFKNLGADAGFSNSDTDSIHKQLCATSSTHYTSDDSINFTKTVLNIGHRNAIESCARRDGLRVQITNIGNTIGADVYYQRPIGITMDASIDKPIIPSTINCQGSLMDALLRSDATLDTKVKHISCGRKYVPSTQDDCSNILHPGGTVEIQTSAGTGYLWFQPLTLPRAQQWIDDGEAAYGQGNFDGAIALFDRAAKCGSSHAASRIGDVFRQNKGDLDFAYIKYQQAIQLGHMATIPHAVTTQGWIRRAQHRCAEALQLYKIGADLGNLHAIQTLAITPFPCS